METLLPVSLSPACVRAILAGRKTQIRLIQKGSEWSPGTLLWVREPWSTNPPMPTDQPDESFLPSHEIQILYRADGADSPVPWYPARTMARWASRLTLRVEGIRPEQLQQISSEDLVREGRMWAESGLAKPGESERDGFARWWDSVHSHPQEQWEGNPPVWVLTFKPVQV
jgi:hypothetical protein